MRKISSSTCSVFVIGGRTLKDDESDGGDADPSWISGLDSLTESLLFRIYVSVSG